MSIKNLLIATSNPGKFNEISNLFNQINIKTIIQNLNNIQHHLQYMFHISNI